MARTTGPEGIREIKLMEGLPGGRPALKAYLDSAGVATIGYGHTRGVKMGDSCTEAQAEAWLRQDLRDAERAVNNLVRVPLNQNQFDALVSFVFNVGGGAFKGSTLLRMLNAGRYEAVPEQLMRWTKARDPNTGKLRVVKGLVNRRSAEVAIWERPDPNEVRLLGKPEESPVERGVRPAPPPSPTKVTETSTGRAQSTALVAGGAAAGTEIVERTFGDQLREAITQIEPLAWMIESMKVIFVALTLALIAWTLWDRRRKVREEGR